MTPIVPLHDVCEVLKGGINPQSMPHQTFAHYSIPAFDDHAKPTIELGEAIKSQKTRIKKGAVLVSKLNPRIPRVWHVNDDNEHARISSTEFVPLLPDTNRLSPEYLAFGLRHSLASGRISGSTSAATKSRERAKPADVAALSIQLPPLAEQRRIVDVLARAEGIVRLRREAQQKAAELIPALFLDLFGDPATNPKRWSAMTLDSVVSL